MLRENQHECLSCCSFHRGMRLFSSGVQGQTRFAGRVTALRRRFLQEQAQRPRAETATRSGTEVTPRARPSPSGRRLWGNKSYSRARSAPRYWSKALWKTGRTCRNESRETVSWGLLGPYKSSSHTDFVSPSAESNVRGIRSCLWGIHVCLFLLVQKRELTLYGLGETAEASLFSL